MDPITVATSIVGILAAAGKVVKILGPVISTLKNKTQSVATICSEVENTRIILLALQTLLDDLNTAPRKRRELIQIGQLIAALTDGVLIFSELEALVLQLGTSTENWQTRIQWARKEKVFASLLSRMQYFKSSMSVILIILQW
jgi:hypothetical protein